MRRGVVLVLGLVWPWAGLAQGKWGMVDTNGTVRIPERYDEIGVFRGDLARGLPLPEFLPGLKGATIVKWLKAEGEEVKKDEALAQVELKEPTIPVMAPAKGMLTQIGVPVGGAAIPGAALGKVRVLGTVDLFAKKQFEVECPSFGPNSGSASVVRWLKLEGDAVGKGEKIAEIRPAQAMAVVLAPGSGTLVDIEVAEGAEAATGQVIARMGVGRVPLRAGKDWFFVDERGNRVTPGRGSVGCHCVRARTGSLWMSGATGSPRAVLTKWGWCREGWLRCGRGTGGVLWMERGNKLARRITTKPGRCGAGWRRCDRRSAGDLWRTTREP